MDILHVFTDRSNVAVCLGEITSSHKPIFHVLSQEIYDGNEIIPVSCLIKINSTINNAHLQL